MLQMLFHERHQRQFYVSTHETHRETSASNTWRLESRKDLLLIEKERAHTIYMSTTIAENHIKKKILKQ